MSGEPMSGDRLARDYSWFSAPFDRGLIQRVASRTKGEPMSEPMSSEERVAVERALGVVDNYGPHDLRATEVLPLADAARRYLALTAPATQPTETPRHGLTAAVAEEFRRVVRKRPMTGEASGGPAEGPGGEG